MSDEEVHKKSSSLYVKIYGGYKVSKGGPLFFLTIGIICCLILYVIILLGGSYDTGIFSSPFDDSGRPPVNFPLIGIILTFLVVGAVVGLFFGLIGLVWYSVLPEQHA